MRLFKELIKYLAIGDISIVYAMIQQDKIYYSLFWIVEHLRY